MIMGRISDMSRKCDAPMFVSWPPHVACTCGRCKGSDRSACFCTGGFSTGGSCCCPGSVSCVLGRGCVVRFVPSSLLLECGPLNVRGQGLGSGLGRRALSPLPPPLPLLLLPSKSGHLHNTQQDYQHSPGGTGAGGGAALAVASAVAGPFSGPKRLGIAWGTPRGLCVTSGCRLGCTFEWRDPRTLTAR